ncbi:MAG: hypothetical protein Q9M29_00920 [Mariprofundaceae bacterium]|nr:hypothetical protein [Mariprofundaceae bacterium]
MPDVILLVNGVDYGGWTGVRVTRSIEQLAGSFELAVTNRDGRGTALPIRDGDLCRLLIDGQQVIAGAVDDRTVSYDAGSHTISISGRDATGDLVDCSVREVQIKGNTLLQIAGTVCKPFGISVLADVDVGGKFTSVDAEPGQTAHELLATLAAQRGVLLCSDDLGNLRITTAGRTRSPGAIHYGRNVLACNAPASMRDRYSDYTVKYQSSQNDQFNGATATQASATTRDPAVKRYRPLTVLAEDGVDLRKRADNERNVRAGRAQRIIYTVSGWYADAGMQTLWQPNTLVPVTDPNQEPGLDNTELLISTITHILDDQGTRTELTVLPRGAFDLLAVPEESGGW